MGNSVFISYSRESREIAEGVARILRSAHVDVWMDKELSGGQDWWDTILHRIRDSKAVIPVIDTNYRYSEACQAEFEYAQGLGKHIVPVRADNVEIEFLPKRVQILHMFDLRRPDQDVILSMVGVVHGIVGGQPLPEPLPKPPPVPLSYAAELAERVRTKHDLSRQEQVDLLHKLKVACKDTRKRDSALKLLRELRQREDTLASIADEIHELLEHGKEGIADTRSVPADRASHQAAAHPDLPWSAPYPKVDRTSHQTAAHPDAGITVPKPGDAADKASNPPGKDYKSPEMGGRQKKDSSVIGRTLRMVSIGPISFALSAWQGSSNIVVRVVIFVFRSILALFYYAFWVGLVGGLLSP